MKAMISGEIPNCLGVCGYVIPIRENYRFLDIIYRYDFMLYHYVIGVNDSILEINTDAVRLIIEIEDIKDIDIFIEKLRIYHSSGQYFKEKQKKTFVVNKNITKALGDKEH